MPDPGSEWAAAAAELDAAEQAAIAERLAEPDPVIEVLVGSDLPGPPEHVAPDTPVSAAHVGINRVLMGIDRASPEAAPDVGDH